jgi:hypothetical protein
MSKKYRLLLILVVFIIGIVWIIHNAFFQKVTKNRALTQVYEKVASSKFPSIQLKDGDIILRRGYGVDSTISTNFSQGEKRYSHVGLISQTDKGTFVIHVVEDKEKSLNGLYIESLGDFLDNISIWAIYRYDFSQKSSKKMMNYIDNLKKRNITFDIEFNLDDDEKMYCSEFIYKVINRTTEKNFIKAGKFFMGKKFVTISDVYENSNSKLIETSHKFIKGKDK